MKPVLQASRIRNNSADYEITAAAALQGYDPETMEPLQKSKEHLQDRQQQASETQSGNGRHASSTAAVIGGVLGGACGAVALAAGWILFHNRRQAKRSTLVTAAITTPTAPSKPGPGAAQFGVSANTVYDYNRYMNPRQQNPPPWSRPHAVQAPMSDMQCTVPKTPTPSPAGNRPQVHQPVQYMHSPPVPQAASLGYQQSQGGFQQPATAALTFDQVWAGLNKLSPIREY
jgi:hypothetical protein